MSVLENLKNTLIKRIDANKLILDHDVENVINRLGYISIFSHRVQHRNDNNFTLAPFTRNNDVKINAILDTYMNDVTDEVGDGKTVKPHERYEWKKRQAEYISDSLRKYFTSGDKQDIIDIIDDIADRFSAVIR